MTKQIPLGHGKFALVDDDMFDGLSKFKWSIAGKGTSQYAARKGCHTPGEPMKTIFMHKEVLKVGEGLEVDHRNLDKLDNQRDNLRPATHSQNTWHRGVQRNNTSGFKGVSWCKRRKVFLAHIRVDLKLHYVGCSKDAKEAARMRDAAAKEYHGEFAVLNFPEG